MRKYAFIDLLAPALDRFDTTTVLSMLDDDCYFQAGNNEPVRGKGEIKVAFNDFFSQIKSVRHRIDDTFETGHTVVTRGYVTYTRKDDSSLRVPVCDVFKMADGKIAEYYIYIDWSQLFN